jgi:general secretion pathway protein F
MVVGGPAGLLVFIGGAARILRAGPPAYASDRATLGLPIIGRLARDLHAARMARTLAPWSPAACPARRAAAHRRTVSQPRASKKASEDIVEAIRGGGSLSAAFKRAGCVPAVLVYMTASGRRRPASDTMMERAAGLS